MRAILISAIMVLATFSLAAGQAIMVDHVDGLNPDETIPVGGTLTFHMRVVGDADAHLMLNNGFIFSSDNVTWGGLTGEFVEPNIDAWFDFVAVMNFFSPDGAGEDTVGIGLLSLFGTGMPASYDGIMYTFTVGPVDGLGQQTLTLDSSWYPPSNPWMWDVIGANVGWGGPYTYLIEGGAPDPTTYCLPQPTVLKDIENILYVYVANEDAAGVDLASVRVQSKIPPYSGTGVTADGFYTTCFIMRFLGSSGFRPVTGDFEATYTVEYDKLDGSHPVLTGDFSLQVYPGDVTFDGTCDMSDVIFMADYFWNGGDIPKYNGDAQYPVPELLDVNQDGTLDPRDVIATIQAASL